MSWRQAVSITRRPIATKPSEKCRRGVGTSADAARKSACATSNGKAFVLLFNFGHLFGIELLEERLGLCDVELGIGRLDAQEKPVDGRAGKTWDVEHGMIG